MLCSICLDALQSPVVTPCGHVFCLDCFISSCRKSPDATKAPCPACRTSVSLLTPNNIFVPEKYRQFIDSNVRRIFLDNSAEEVLKERVAQLETRVKSLESQKDLLMNKCESYMTSSSRHAENEKEMRARCTWLQNELRRANGAVAQLLEGSVVQLLIPDNPVAAIPLPNVADNSDPSVGSPSRFGILPERRGDGIPNHTPPASGRRTAPLPKRRRVSRQGITTT